MRQVALSSTEKTNVVPKPVNTFTPYTDDEALSLIVSNKLINHKILEATKKCYPNNITITEKSAEVQLQSLLDHLAEPVLHTLPPTCLSNLILTIKWGFDGSSGHSAYKQRSNEDFNDGNLMITSLVPLELYTRESNSSNKIIVWKNHRPSSSRSCVPIRIQFIEKST